MTGWERERSHPVRFQDDHDYWCSLVTVTFPGERQPATLLAISETPPPIPAVPPFFYKRNEEGKMNHRTRRVSAAAGETNEESHAEEGDENHLNGEDDEIEDMDAMLETEPNHQGSFCEMPIIQVATNNRCRADEANECHRDQEPSNDVPLKPSAIRHGQSKRSGSLSFSRKNASVWRRPSSSEISGSQPRICFALVISGRRRWGSSCGSFS